MTPQRRAWFLLPSDLDETTTTKYHVRWAVRVSRSLRVRTYADPIRANIIIAPCVYKTGTQTPSADTDRSVAFALQVRVRVV